MTPKKNTFHYAVYEYLHDKIQDPAYKDLDYEMICSNDGFISEYKKQHKYIRKLLTVLGIEDSNIFFDPYVDNTYQYDLDNNEIDFISDIIYKLNNDDLWKKIRKLDNRRYDGFINLYKEVNDRNKLIQELKIVIDGFMQICERKYGNESRKYKLFSEQLYIFTQYNQLVWLKKIEDTMLNAIPVTYEDVTNTEVGLLLSEYQKFTKNIENEVSEIVDKYSKEWENLKKNKRNKVNHYTNIVGCDLDDAIKHLIELIKEEDNDVGIYFEKLLNNIDVTENDTKEEFCRKQSILKKSFMKLNANERLVLGELFENKL